MKLLLFIPILFPAMILEAQYSGNYYLNFDNQDGLDHLQIDTISNRNNVWQIGIPNKGKFDSAYSVPNAICTDLHNSYLSNDTSSFYIHNLANGGFEKSHTVILGGRYQIDSDSLADYGILEFSPDNGITWINLITDTIYTMF